MTQVAVKPELIRWAVERSGLPIEELRTKFPKLDDWRSGKSKPSFSQLQSFAKKTMTPFGTMFLRQPPADELPIPDFRTKGDVELSRYSPDLLETIETMQRRQAWMREYLIDDGHGPLDFVGSTKGEEGVTTLAARIRQRLGLSESWAKDVPNWEAGLAKFRKAIEDVGVLVFSNSVVGLSNHRPLDPNEFRGFVLIDKYAPVIFLNDADTKSARIFTLAHELAHVWLGQDGLFNLIDMQSPRKHVEQYCNRVAAETLIPTSLFKPLWAQFRESENRFRLLAERFKVSPIVVARRSLDLRLIAEPEFFLFYKDAQREWRLLREQQKDTSGGNFYSTQNARLGERFGNAVVRATQEGRLTYRETQRLSGMKPQTFRKYSEKATERMRNEW